MTRSTVYPAADGQHFAPSGIGSAIGIPGGHTHR